MPDEYKILFFPRLLCPEVIDDAIDLLRPGLPWASGRHSMDTVRRYILDGRWQLFMVFRVTGNKAVAAMATSISQYPLLKMINLVFCGGSGMEGWFNPLLAEIETYAREQGCAGMELAGRKGWKRALMKRGWSDTHIISELIFAEEVVAAPELKVVGASQ